ncbi:hypothetical protein RND71_020641 [Anisodus tanguticus]|uniref:Peptidase M48 domain-containing protein n=1 Tax=Anisodus tanguticus TaxID=243964 RepID=A0AAE1VHR8_9SOLA|nr:hypothetical protein RND71_020641 [Anisodus tanguticus]
MASVPLPALYFSLSSNFDSRTKHPISSPCTGFRKQRFSLFVCRSASVTFRDLDADDFRHPLDRQAVLAHELGHLKCDHGVWLTFANILTLGAYTVPGVGVLIAQRLEEQLFRWLRAAELTCDRAALLVAQDPKVVVSVLMKLAGGCPSLSDQLNVDAFLEQARSYEKASSSPVGWYIRNAQTRQLSHPLPVLRAREIDEWSRSQEYRSLLQRAIQRSVIQQLDTWTGESHILTYGKNSNHED